MNRHPLVPPQRLKSVARAVVRLATDAGQAQPAVKSRAAGIAYVDPQGRALFLKRGGVGDQAGTWCFPGGGIETGETAEDAAVRESREECGANPYGARSVLAHTAMDGGGHYTTFAQPVKHAFTPRLNEEHTEHTWAPLGEPPQPLHPGVRQALSGMAMDNWEESKHPRGEGGQFGSGGGATAGGEAGAKIAGLFSKSLGMKRADMPQVPGDHKEAFLSELRGKTTLKPEMVKASTLRPTQQDFKADQIEAMAKAGVDPKKGNILVSSDGYVLDGHHRWAAAALNGGEISTIKVGMPIRQLLKAAEDFNQRAGVQRRTLSTPSTAQDADWDESKHPRADNGQFGNGSGGGSPAVDPKPRAQISAPAPAGYRQGMPEAPKARAAAPGARREGPAAAAGPGPKAPAMATPPQKTKHAPLTPEQHAIESRMAATLGQQKVGIDQDGNSVYKTTDPAQYRRAVAAYAKLEDAEGGKVLNTDVARELSEDYMADRTQAAAVHEPSSQFIKDRYAEMLAQPPGPGELPVVLFTAGGAGAGKSTAIKGVKDVADLKAKAQIVYDTNLDGYSSGKKKIEQALAAGKRVNIAMIVRDPEDALVNGALLRAESQRKKFGTGRTVPLATHIKTHTGAVETVNRLAAEYADHKDVHITVIDNTHGFGKAKVQSVEWLKNVAYNDIEERVKKALEREHDEGRISHETYRGFAGAGAAHDEGDSRDLPRSARSDGSIQPQPGRSPGGKPEPPGSRQEARLGQDRLPDWAAPSGAAVVSGAGMRALRAAGLLAQDWNESDHPRAKNGQFGSGGSSSSAPDDDIHAEWDAASETAEAKPGKAHPLKESADRIASAKAKLKEHEANGTKLADFYRKQIIPSHEKAHEKLKRAFEAFEKYGDGTELSSEDGKRHIVLLPDASEPGRYRYQRFDENGFSGHHTEDSPEQAIADAASQGFVVSNPGVLDKLASTSKWAHGMAVSAIIQAHASGLIDWKTATDKIAALPDPGMAQDDEHWITVNGGEGKGQPILVTEGGVVVGGAGGNLNGKVLDPKSKSAPRASEPNKASKSADIAKALQNRNRNSAASIAQMNRIAANPNPRLMMAAPTMNDGAPVVTDLAGKGIAKLTGHRDWIVTGKREIPIRYAVVEADQLAASNRADGTKNEDYAKDPNKLVAINNGRTAAMIEAYSRGTADAYKAAIAKAERVHGIPGKDIKAMKAPVLVRVMDAADVDEHIGDESNSTQTLSLSAIEQAQNDAARFDPSGIEYNDDGTPSDASVKGFINAMPESERQSLAPNGRPTKQAIDRMLAATFHAAYGDSELVGLMAQATDPESRNLISGMSKAAGPMAKLKDAGELDIRELVTGAAKQIINAVRSGVSIKKFLKQGDLLTNSAEDQIAALFAENARSAKAIGEKLTAAATFAYQESQKEGTDMFGDPIPQASRTDVLENLHAQS